MSGIKKLAGQTLWYGGSTIISRFLSYLLTPYLTLKLAASQFGDYTIMYSVIPFFTVFFTYGMETAYFRFVQKEENKKTLYNTASVSLICSTLLMAALMIIFRNQIARLISLKTHSEYVIWSALILAFDTLAVVPMAKLRQENRPRKFAFIRLSAILVYIGAIYFFISVCPAIVASGNGGFITLFYKPGYAVGYILVANAIQSLFALLLVWKSFTSFQWEFNREFWKEMIIYTAPLLIVNFGGVINETFDRVMLAWWSPAATETAKHAEVGTYGACYKLSILITLFIQAFRMGAEPFFFKQASGENPQRVYARVMKFFVITICTMFLVVALFLDIWKYFIRNEAMWAGLKVVPILLLANMFLGIYYNLSIWYKLTNKTMLGAAITVAGAILTILINYLFIPHFGYMACAWATFLCYGTMMVLSYTWGQRHYHVPYAWKKLVAYMCIVVLLYFVHQGLRALVSGFLFSTVAGLVLLGLFLLLIIRVEKKEFQKLPFIGRYV